MKRALIPLALAIACRTSNGSGSAPVMGAATSVAPAAASAPAEFVKLTIVGTNDVHGWVQPHLTKTQDGAEIAEGGAATFAGYLRILRDENPGGVVLLDAGDIFQGTLASNLTEGAVVVDAFNHLGYAAAVAGKHDQARQVLAELHERAQHTYIKPLASAWILIGLGAKDLAFTWLDQAYTEHDPYLTLLNADPVYDRLRGDPRFDKLLQRIALADYRPGSRPPSGRRPGSPCGDGQPSLR